MYLCEHCLYSSINIGKQVFVLAIFTYSIIASMESFSRSHKDQRRQNSPQVALCLNPECESFSRSFVFGTSSQLKDNGEAHHKCGKWCLSLSEIKQMTDISFSADRSEIMDFLCDPLKSLFEVNALLRNGWQEQIVVIFKSIKQQFIQTLDKVMSDCLEKISNGTQHVRDICASIKELEESQHIESWTIKNQRIYHDNLHQQLKEISSIGILKLLDFEGVARQIEIIKDQMRRLTCSVWQKESVFSRTEREIDLKCREELKDWADISTREDMNIKLQKIYSALKLKQMRFEIHSDSVAIRCGRCAKKILGKGGNKQAKRAECQENLLRHMCHKHEEQVLELCLKKGKTSCQLELEQFLDEILTQGARRFLVVDRQNINSENAIEGLEKQVYKLEIVSKGRQNLASGKYLVAQSKGKDSADILIIIVLYEIGRLAPSATMTLLTKDHFGETLVAIMEGLGRHVELDSCYMGKKQSNQSQQMMIDQQ